MHLSTVSVTIGSLATTSTACAVLIWVLVEDLRNYRIRNTAVLALLACFVVDCAVRDRITLLASHTILAGSVFAFAAGAFALRMMGGGDAKLLSAAVLWVGPEGAVLFASLLFVATVAYVAGAWAGLTPSRRIGGRLAIPFGPSIASAWLGFIGFAWLL